MWLKKLVGITLIITSLAISVLLVWGVVFTKPDPSEIGQAGDTTPVGDVAPTPDPAPTPTPATPPPPPAATPTAPVVTLTASPTSVVSGGSVTLGWSINAANPVPTCTASGGWTGVKTTSGSAVVKPTANTTYTLTCVNSVGSGTKSATVSIKAAVASYCSGLSPCYGKSDLAAHSSAGNCWGYIGNIMSNLTPFASVHSGGSATINGACGKDLLPILNGQTPSAGQTKKHSSGNINLIKSTYKVGYYDSTKP
jgi:hypothetical protein